MPKFNAKGLELVKHFEGLYLSNEDSLSDDEYSALVSFTYNRGAGRFRS